MAITSVTLGGLEICDTPQYGAKRELLVALRSGVPREPVLVRMQARHPKFVRSQVDAKAFPLGVNLRRRTLTERDADLQALEAASGGGALVNLTYTLNGTIYSWQVHVGPFVPDLHLHEASASAVAPDPVPVAS